MQTYKIPKNLQETRNRKNYLPETEREKYPNYGKYTILFSEGSNTDCIIVHKEHYKIWIITHIVLAFYRVRMKNMANDSENKSISICYMVYLVFIQ